MVTFFLLFFPLTVFSISKVTLDFISTSQNWSVLNSSSPGFPGSNYSSGIECGEIVKVGDYFHLVITELMTPYCGGGPNGLPWCTTQLTHWVSTNTIDWTRKGQIIPNGTEKCNTYSNNAVYWSPLLSYSPNDDYWYLTYVGYDIPCGNYPQNGLIWLAKSNIKGYENGINGIFTPLNYSIMHGIQQPWWEGTKDIVDSFSNIYLIPNDTNSDGYTYAAIYGSCCQPNQLVGMAFNYNNNMESEWTRSEQNPLYFSDGAENPIITTYISDNNITIYVAIYCVNSQENKGIGLSWSLNGIGWSETEVFSPNTGIPYARVPLGLIPVDGEHGNFTLFYTDFLARHAGNTGVWYGQEGLYVSKVMVNVTM
eukprot:453952_1